MSTIQQSQTIVTKLVDDDAGGLRLEKPTKDPVNDCARVGHALHLRQQQPEPRQIYHVSWDHRKMCPAGLEIDDKTISLFLQGEVLGLENDDPIGRYYRLASFRLGDDEADEEAVLYLF